MGKNSPPAVSTGQLTPAQIQLLDFISHLEASSIYESISTTLAMSISDFRDRDDSDSGPTQKVLEAWFFTLELLRHIHLIAAETPTE